MPEKDEPASPAEPLEIRSKVCLSMSFKSCKNCKKPIEIGENYARWHVRTAEGWHVEHYHLKCEQ